MNQEIIQKKNKITNFLFKIGTVLIAISLILNCRAIWNSTPNGNFYSRIEFIFMIVGFILSVLSLKNIRITKRYISVFIFLSIYILIYLFYGMNQTNFRNSLNYYFAFCCCFFYILFFKENNKLQLLIDYYVNIMTIIACISLFFWIFGSVFKILNPNRVIYSYWAGVNGNALPVRSYFNIYFETQTVNSGIIRNSSIFTEAPMASLNFSIALIFENLFNMGDRLHNFKQFILIICILSTFSYTGYIAILLLVILRSLFTKYKNKVILLPFIILVVLISLFLIHYLLNDKLSTSSGQTRVDDFRAGYLAWKMHPIIGSGINSSAYQNFMSNWRSNNLGFSNTMMDVLASGGVYMFLLYLGSVIYSIGISIKSHNYNNIIFLIILIYLFVTTIFTNTYILFFLFIFMVINSMNFQINQNIY